MRQGTARRAALFASVSAGLMTLSAVGLAPVHAASSRSAQAARAARPHPDAFAVYFRHDAVGRSMRALAMTSCGTERWPVKTGTDDDRGRVTRTSRDVSIRYLRNRPAPSERPETSRVAPVELTTYRLHARLVEYVREADSDYHLVLADPQGRTMVVEIPAPSCVGRISPFRKTITAARQAMNSHFAVTSDFQQANVSVVVRGIGFFDFLHGQTGMAPNGVELHPVTGIRFP